MATKVKDIPILGLSTSPNDYQSTDGNLAAAAGLLHDTGAITPSQAPKVITKLSNSTSRVVYLHKNMDYQHLIVLDAAGTPSYIIYDNDAIAATNTLPSAPTGVTSVIAIGNTLICYTPSATHYYLWQNAQASYQYLGTQIPDLHIRFGLEGETKVYYYKEKEQIDAATNKYYDSLCCVKYGDTESWTPGWENITSLPLHVRTQTTEAVLSRVNKFVSEDCHDKGRFCMPFLVRYAYRLFDGSHVLHSSPVLMIPSTGAPIAPIHAIMPGDNEYYFHIIGTAAELNYQMLNYADISSALDKWRDIVKGIDIYISSPFYTYDQSAQVTKIISDGVKIEHTSGSWFIRINKSNLYWYNNVKKNYTISAKHQLVENRIDSNWDSNFTPTSNNPQKKTIDNNIQYSDITDSSAVGRGEQFKPTIEEAHDGFSHYINIGGDRSDGCLMRDDFDFNNGASTSTNYRPCYFFYGIPEYPWDKIEKEARECSSFYLIKELELSELSATKTVMKIDSGVINTISTRELMDDDYDSHDIKSPHMIAEYNSRINMADIKSAKFQGYDAQSSNCAQTVDDGNITKAIAYITIKSDQGTTVVKKITAIQDLNQSGAASFNYVYYPDPDATKMVLYVKIYNRHVVKRCEISLTEHKGLNGAINVSLNDRVFTTVSGYTDIEDTTFDTTEGYTGDTTLHYPNYLYTSEATNPFAFRAANIEQIGSGKIIAIVPSAIPLSQGQFGDFPMYAFTTDGIWALYVNATGGWASKQPVSRDVALSANAILQLDQSVIFATSRGLMQISGSSITCISEVFDGADDLFLSKYQDHIRDLVQLYAQFDATNVFPSFKDYVAGDKASMHYDYTNQRIICANADYPVVYVFNMRDKLWTTELLQVTSSVNSYPSAYAMAKSGSDAVLIDFTQPDADNAIQMPTSGYLLTRPIKLTLPDDLKTVSTVIARGNFSKDKVKLVLYASRDLDNWLIIGTSSTSRLSLHHGTPYRYFRVALITDLLPTQSISSLTIEFEPRMQNKLR